MKTTKYCFIALVTLTATFLAMALSLQSRGVQGQVAPSVSCPNPIIVNLSVSAPAAATPTASDFPTPVPPLTNFGGTALNKTLRHTFTWRPSGDCCQYIKGTLTVKYKALQGGPAGSATSANDAIAIFSNGVALLSQPLFSGAVTTGQTGTKTIALTPAMLANHRLSFAVQDDTEVLSASLEVTGCCVRK